MDSALWGAIGTAVGAAASIGTTWLTNRNAARLQADAKAAEQMAAKHAFQRETILELQDAFHNAIRLLSLAHVENCRAQAKGIAWGQYWLPDDLAENIRLANRRVMLLVERVVDDDLRKSVKALMAEANSTAECASREEAEARLDGVTMKSVAAIEQSGAVLRSAY